MNKENANVTEKTPEQIAEETRARQMADAGDNNAPQVNGEKPVCGISGVELKEGDEVVRQVIPATEGSEGYSRLVLLSALSEDERAALAEGDVKTFPDVA